MKAVWLNNSLRTTWLRSKKEMGEASASPVRQIEHLRNIPKHYGVLTTLAHKPSIVAEQATSSYSFRFSELSQPI